MKKLACIILLIFPTVIFGQKYEIKGKVIDKETQEAIIDAKISIDNLDLYIKISPSGEFSIKNLKKATHQLQVSHIGYDTKNIEVNASQTKYVLIELETANIMQEAIIVKATRAEYNSPTPQVLISQQDLRQNNDGSDLPVLLRLTPSVVSTSYAGNGIGYSDIRIRGTDIKRINVTLNGVPMNIPESHGVYFVDLPDIASSVNSIQIQRGVGTSTNGAATFGASINIETSRLSTNPHIDISSNYGSFNTMKNTLSFGTGLLKNKIALEGRLSKISSDGYIDRATSDLQSIYLSGGYFGKKDVLKFIFTLGDEKTYLAWNGTPKDSLISNRTYNPAGAIYKDDSLTGYYNNQTDNYQQAYYQLHYIHEFNRNLKLTNTLFYTRGGGYYESYKNHKKFKDYGMQNVIIGNDTLTRTNLIRQKWVTNDYYGVNLNLHYSKGKIKNTTGINYLNYVGDHYGYVIWAQYASDGFIDKAFYFNTGKKLEYGIFNKTQYSITDKLYTYIDLQFRHTDYRIEGTHDNLEDISQKHLFDFFNPKTGFHYQINNKVSSYFSFAISHREPGRSVYRDAREGQEIKAERLHDFELGTRLSFNKMRAEINTYFMNYKDQLVLTGEVNNVGDPILVNVPKSYRAGIEISTSLQIVNNLNWGMSVNISRNKIENYTHHVIEFSDYSYVEENFTETDISFSPCIIASSQIEYSFQNTRITWASKYVGKQFIDNTSNDDRALDAYFVNDLTLSHTFKVKYFKNLSIYIKANNILNEMYENNAWVYPYYYGGEYYEENGYYPQAGRNFSGGINISF
jgi:iron complex outermembrane receptor protein